MNRVQRMNWSRPSNDIAQRNLIKPNARPLHKTWLREMNVERALHMYVQAVFLVPPQFSGSLFFLLWHNVEVILRTRTIFNRNDPYGRPINAFLSQIRNYQIAPHFLDEGRTFPILIGSVDQRSSCVP